MGGCINKEQSNLSILEKMKKDYSKLKIDVQLEIEKFDKIEDGPRKQLKRIETTKKIIELFCSQIDRSYIDYYHTQTPADLHRVMTAIKKQIDLIIQYHSSAFDNIQSDSQSSACLLAEKESIEIEMKALRQVVSIIAEKQIQNEKIHDSFVFVEQYRAENEMLKMRLGETKRQMNKLNQELQTQLANSIQLSADFSQKELEDLRLCNKELEKKIKKHQHKISELSQQNSNLKKEIQNLIATKQQYKSKIFQITQTMSSLAIANVQSNKNIDGHISELRKKEEEIRNKAIEISNLEKKLTLIQQLLHKKKQDIESTQIELKTVKEKVEKLEDQISKKQALISSITSQKLKAQKEIQFLRQTVKLKDNQSQFNFKKFQEQIDAFDFEDKFQVKETETQFSENSSIQ